MKKRVLIIAMAMLVLLSGQALACMGNAQCDYNGPYIETGRRTENGLTWVTYMCPVCWTHFGHVFAENEMETPIATLLYHEPAYTEAMNAIQKGE